jgi:hypothetical protein
MGAGSVDPDESYADSMFDAITAGAQDRPEARVLDRLVGTWRTKTAWEPIVGHGVRHLEGRTETVPIYGGRMLRSRTFDPDGEATGDLILAYDGLVGDYIGFAFNSLSTFFVVERGTYDPELDRFELDALEPRRDGGPSVRFRRTIQFDGDAAYTASISYPDVPPGTYGPMAITHERIG